MTSSSNSSFIEEEKSSLCNIVINVFLPEVHHQRLLKCEASSEDVNKAFLEERLSPDPKKAFGHLLNELLYKYLQLQTKLSRLQRSRRTRSLNSVEVYSVEWQ